MFVVVQFEPRTPIEPKGVDSLVAVHGPFDNESAATEWAGVMSTRHAAFREQQTQEKGWSTIPHRWVIEDLVDPKVLFERAA